MPKSAAGVQGRGGKRNRHATSPGSDSFGPLGSQASVEGGDAGALASSSCQAGERTGGRCGQFLRHTHLLDRPHGVTTADAVAGSPCRSARRGCGATPLCRRRNLFRTRTRPCGPFQITVCSRQGLLEQAGVNPGRVEAHPAVGIAVTAVDGGLAARGRKASRARHRWAAAAARPWPWPLASSSLPTSQLVRLNQAFAHPQPRALVEVKIMRRRSHLVRNCRSTTPSTSPILPAHLGAANDRRQRTPSASSMAPCMILQFPFPCSSPATLGFRYSVTPAVEAWARWAAPKAIIHIASAGRPAWRRSRDRFSSSSSAKKRNFPSQAHAPSARAPLVRVRAMHAVGF